MSVEDEFLKQIAIAAQTYEKGVAPPKRAAAGSGRMRMPGRGRAATSIDAHHAEMAAFNEETKQTALRALAAGDYANVGIFPGYGTTQTLYEMRKAIQTINDLRQMDFDALMLAVEYSFMSCRVGNTPAVFQQNTGVPFLTGVGLMAFGKMSGRKDMVAFLTPFLTDALSSRLADPADILLAAITRHLLAQSDDQGLMAAVNTYAKAGEDRLDAMIRFNGDLQNHAKRTQTLPAIFALWPVVSLYVLDQLHIDPGETFGFLLTKAKSATYTCDEVIEAFEVALA